MTLLLTIELVLLFCVIVLQAVHMYIDYAFQPDIPEIDEISQDLLMRLNKSNAGVISGTERQKKKADQLLGQAMMERYPIVSMATQYYPPLGRFLENNANMVPYVAQILMGGVDKLGGKLDLPVEVKQMLAGFMNQAPPEQ